MTEYCCQVCILSTMTGDVLPLNCQLCAGMHVESTKAPNLDILLIFTIHSNILLFRYSDRILLSSMHSIYDDSLCFATSTDDCVLACTWNRPKPKTTAKISKCSFWFSQYIANILVLPSSEKYIKQFIFTQRREASNCWCRITLYYSALWFENVYWMHFELGNL